MDTSPRIVSLVIVIGLGSLVGISRPGTHRLLKLKTRRWVDLEEGQDRRVEELSAIPVGGSGWTPATRSANSCMR